MNEDLYSLYTNELEWVKKEDKLIEYLLQNNLRYIPIINKDIIDAVYNLFFHGIIDETNKDDTYLLYVGVYYDIAKDITQRNKYYLLSSKHNPFAAMNLACNYLLNENNEKVMEYMLMAIDNGFPSSIFMYVVKDHLIAHKYMPELRLHLLLKYPTPLFRQFIKTHATNLKKECVICYVNDLQYKCDCLEHAYCINCIHAIYTIHKKCPECRFPTHPSYNTIFGAEAEATEEETP